MTVNRPASRTTVAGLRQRLDYEFVNPAQLTAREYSALTASERLAYDDTRLQWFGSGFRVATSESQELIRLVKGYLRTSNPFAVGERLVLVDGPAHIGKTTMLERTLAAAIEKTESRTNPNYRAEGQVPVAYIEVEPRSTPKSVAASILAFYGVPAGERRTQRQISTNACEVMLARGTRVLIVDELQMLKLHGPSGDDAINALKSIINDTGVVTVLAGVDISQKLGSRAAEQLITRGQTLVMRPYTYATEPDRELWGELLVAFAREMRLIEWDPNEIIAFADPLHGLTGGSIGDLRRVLGTAMFALIDGKTSPHDAERLTAQHVFGKAAQDLLQGQPRTVTGSRNTRTGHVA